MLYAKNLPRKITEEEFSCPFQASNISFLAMKVLRDTAFVEFSGKELQIENLTFPEKEIAEKALKSIQGTILKGKPMILCYSNRSQVQ